MTARIDPPTDVQQAVAAAIRACHAWRPVSVQAPIHDTVESGVCGLIDDWPVHANAAAYGLLWFGALGGVFGLVVLWFAYRVARGTYRVIRAHVGRWASVT